MELPAFPASLISHFLKSVKSRHAFYCSCRFLRDNQGCHSLDTAIRTGNFYGILKNGTVRDLSVLIWWRCGQIDPNYHNKWDNLLQRFPWMCNSDPIFIDRSEQHDALTETSSQNPTESALISRIVQFILERNILAEIFYENRCECCVIIIYIIESLLLSGNMDQNVLRAMSPKYLINRDFVVRRMAYCACLCKKTWTSRVQIPSNRFHIFRSPSTCEIKVQTLFETYLHAFNMDVSLYIDDLVDMVACGMYQNARKASFPCAFKNVFRAYCSILYFA